MANLAIIENKSNLEALLKQYEPKVATLLPANSGYTPEKMCYMLVKAAVQNPTIMKCSQISVLGAFLTAVQLGLEPNTPMQYAHLIPYFNSKAGAYELTLQLGYQGLLELIYRGGAVRRLFADVVYKDDVFEFEQGLNPVLRHKPSFTTERIASNVIAAYAIVDTTDGGQNMVVLTKQDLDKIQKSSKSKNVWADWYEEMCKKTALKRLVKFLKKTPELAAGVDVDSRSEAGKPKVIDIESGEIVDTEETSAGNVLDEASLEWDTAIDECEKKEDLQGVWNKGLKDFTENERVPKLMREALVNHFNSKLTELK